jgi:hypothetical protein
MGALTDEAMARTGEDDFGEPTWQEGLALVVDGLEQEARLTDLGVEIALSGVVDYLATRLALTAWRRDHPEVADETNERPIVIVGQPRTGTTILYDLLAQDPALRAPLTWEVDKPVPPPETATYESDPRIAEVQATLDMVDAVMPGFTTFHPMGAQLAQECVRIYAPDFRSMIFPIQFRLPTYNRWLVHQADMAPAYRWHRRYLQHLQSRHPADQWLLKSPAHLWSMEALAAEYPDAIVVQTHRDPLKVIASVSALSAHLRRMSSDDISLPEIAAGYADDIFLGLERGMDSRANGTFPPDQVVDVQFSDFQADPFVTIRALYGALGRELSAPAEANMRAFLSTHPGDGGGRGDRYRFADTELDEVELRERSALYQERFGVTSEPVI